MGLDFVNMTNEEWISYLEVEYQKSYHRFWAAQIGSLLLFMPLFLWLFFGFPIEYFGYSLMGCILFSLLNSFLVGMRDDARDRLKRWRKMYGIEDELSQNDIFSIDDSL